MAIKENTGRNAKPDEISQVIGSDGFYQRWYPPGLRERCLGEHSRDLVGVSRFYPMADPIVEDGKIKTDEKGEPVKRTPIVVDFEPNPRDGKMYLEEKRKFFFEKNIVYVPVFLTELLTKEDFAAKLEEERQTLIRGFREEMEDKAMDSVEVPMFSDENLIAEVEALALERVKILGLRGAAKNKRLRVEKEAILKEKLDGMAARRRENPVPAPVG